EQNFPCIQLEFKNTKGIFDITITKKNDNFYIGIFDFTDHYEASHTLAQEKNESIIKSQLLQIQHNNIVLEKELVDLKNDQLKKSQEFKDEFLANMSHEIRTPLNAILGFTKLLQKFDYNEEQKQFLDAISISGNNLKVIINDILDMSKIEAGKLTISQVDFSFKQLIQNLHETYKLRLQNKNIELIIDIDQSVPEYLNGDSIRINQVLINLLENAFKFTQEGSITLKATNKGISENTINLNFEVIDTGIGIKAEKLKSIFESFSQAHDNNVKNYGGTGLGLTIVKNLVELMKGTVRAASNYGFGTTFSFQIPLGLAESKRKIEKTSSVEKFEEISEKHHILLAEDVTINQLLAKKIILSFGYDLTIVNNGQEAIDELHKNEYDILLLDLRMPVLDGYETAKKIRTELVEPLKNIPIIALTAHAMDQEKEKCKEYGFNEYVSIPFEPEDLIDRLKKLQA
ncbi:MAG: response regulator, partial [Flavobacteriaceae bacterium]|nr:response regulator [Flavobacteriaceae bacterium]